MGRVINPPKLESNKRKKYIRVRKKQSSGEQVQGGGVATEGGVASCFGILGMEKRVVVATAGPLGRDFSRVR
jgi:hypothetical protein